MHNFSLVQCICFIVKIENQSAIFEILKKSIEENDNIIKNAVHEVDNPALSAVTCSPDYLKNLMEGCLECLQAAFCLSQNNPADLVVGANRIAAKLSMFIVQGRATSNKSPDILLGESMLRSINVFNKDFLTISCCRYG